jgi:hypothetical protein
MDSSFDADGPGDDLSTAFCTETLAERAMIPEGFVNTPDSRTDVPIEVIGGGRCLRVGQSVQSLLGQTNVEIGGPKNTKKRCAI